jgi:hypothetical protein
MIPLAKAVLCLDCEHITESRSDRCAHCGSKGLLSLANVLGQLHTAVEGKVKDSCRLLV